MFLHYSPFWLKSYFSDYVWHIPTSEKVIYLTFDDGPIPNVTEFVLETLEKYCAKATFFCIGNNIIKNPNIFEKLVSMGHSVGNHTFNHLNGWENTNEYYIGNIAQCDESLNIETQLFRPPYGRIKGSQARELKHKNIIMWDVLSGDFSPKVSPERCLKKTIRYSKPGSIVLFHDSIKASKNMQFTLPRYLEHFQNLGYRFESIPMNANGMA